MSLVLRWKQKWQYFMNIRLWRMLLLYIYIYGEAISRNLTIRSCWKIIINSFCIRRCLWMKFAFKWALSSGGRESEAKKRIINIRKFAIALNGRFDCFIVLCKQQYSFFPYHKFHRMFLYSIKSLLMFQNYDSTPDLKVDQVFIVFFFFNNSFNKHKCKIRAS